MEHWCRATAVDRSELRPIWPATPFAAEAHALLTADADDDALGGLMAEAFHGERGERLLQQVAHAHPHGFGELEDDPWLTTNGYSLPRAEPFASRATARLVASLAHEADTLPLYVPRLLFRQRQRPSAPAVLSVPETRDRCAHLVRQFCALGYFEDTFGSECDDAVDDDPAGDGQRALAERLQVDGALWPLHRWQDGQVVLTGTQKAWSDEVFFEVVEALDEVVARPRQRRWHSFHAGWDYANHSRLSGQAVYRWRVNEMLDASVVPFRLAVSGSDEGLLVHATGDPRDELLEQAHPALTDTERDEVAHAVVSLRARGAPREAKRSAVVTLAGIFQASRDLLKDRLKKDEGGLFNLANNFALRHRDAKQHGDYDEAYLDWIFWWYLATIELSDRLLARDTAAPS